MGEVNELPLLHKYVIRPQDDLKLVMTKLHYRLCVKQVSQVIHRRSLGASISEAVDICELAPISPPRHTVSMSNADCMTSHNHTDMEPLVFSDDPHCVSSPKLLSPADSSYCGTMKSDDSGIVMDDSHNFSMTSSDHEEREADVTSTDASPLEEHHEFIQREATPSPISVEETPIEPHDLINQPITSDDFVDEFFRQSVEDDEATLEDNEESSMDTSIEVTQALPIQTLQETRAEENVVTSQQRDDVSSRQPDSQSQTGLQAEEEFQDANQEVPESVPTNLELTEDIVEEDEVEEEIIEKQTVEEEKQTIESSIFAEVTEESKEEIGEKLDELKEKFPEMFEDMLENGRETPKTAEVQSEEVEETQEPNEAEEEEEEEEEEEDQRVDFVKDDEQEIEEVNLEPGIRCHDAYQALDILKTRYRLSDTPVKKFIITFSSWNVNQISRVPMQKSNRCSWWEDDVKDLDSPDMDEDDPHVDELMEQIYSRQGEISDLVDRIMEAEAEKIRASQRESEATEPKASDVQPASKPEEIQDIIEEPVMVPQSESAPIDSEPTAAEKKKTRNALRRFMHAMRKRLRRNRPPSDSNRIKS